MVEIENRQGNGNMDRWNEELLSPGQKEI